MTAGILTLAFLGIFGTDIGTSALPLLKSPAGPRASAMGESFTALADDATAIYWNPAGLAYVKDAQLFVSHQEWFADIRDEYVSAAFGRGAGKFGLGMCYSGSYKIEVWDPDNQRSPVWTTDNHTGFLALGYGFPIQDRYAVGVGAKLAADYLGTSEDYGGGAGLDLGFIAQPWPFLNLGVSGQNLGLAYYNRNGNIYALPSAARIGAAFRVTNFSLVSDVLLPLDNNPSFHLGGEYTALNTIIFRAGYKTGPQDLFSLGFLSGLCLGMGVHVGLFDVDYAFVPYGDLGSVHRVGVRTVFPARGYGSLKIMTFDARNKEPLAAEIEIAGIRQEKVAATRSGVVRLERLGEGWLRFRVSYPGYIPVRESLYSFGDRDQILNVELTKPGRGTIWGRVMDAVTQRNIAARVTYSGRSQDDFMVDSAQVSFVIKDLVAGSYVFKVYGPNEEYFAQTCTLVVSPNQVTNKDFLLLRKRQKIILKGVNFETGKAELRAEFLSNLDEAGRILVENPKIVVELGGHTDPREIKTPEYPSNWELSQARAEAVRKYLIEKFKIKPERLVARGYADTSPIASNDTEEGMAKNRRTEFVVLEE
jgi:outer membrane protein OmpA-like peptidoglycan-associated protein